MKTIHRYWTISKLVENIDKIEFPEFQREPTVWKLGKKQIWFVLFGIQTVICWFVN